jgi:hypothetical protein
LDWSAHAPEEANTISAIVGKRAELFPSIEPAAEIEALNAQLAEVMAGAYPLTPMRALECSNDR